MISAKYVVILFPFALVVGGCASTQRADSVNGSGRPADQSSARTLDRHSSADDEMLSAHSEPVPAPDGRHEITLEELRGCVQSHSAVLIDARDPYDFSHGHLTGAVNLPAGKQMDKYFSKELRDVAPNQLVIIYCASASCSAGEMVYDFLAAQGFTNMRVFKPGWRVLKDANL